MVNSRIIICLEWLTHLFGQLLLVVDEHMRMLRTKELGWSSMFWFFFLRSFGAEQYGIESQFLLKLLFLEKCRETTEKMKIFWY